MFHPLRPIEIPVLLLFASSLLCVDGKLLENFKSAVYPCSPGLLLFRSILSTTETRVSLSECFIRCSLDEDCDASILQTYSTGRAKCTSLGPVLGNLSSIQMPLTVDRSLSCKVMLKDYNGCLNGGTLHFGACACTNGFIGFQSSIVGLEVYRFCIGTEEPIPSTWERCELVRPPSWPHREWVAVVTAFGTASPTYTIHNDTINDILDYCDAKVRIRTIDFTATVIVSQMWTAKFPSGTRILSHLQLEKSSWDRLTPGGTRTIRYFHYDGSTQDIVFTGSAGSYTISETPGAYEFLATTTNSFPEYIVNDATNNAFLKSVLDDGCSVFRSNFARDTSPKIVVQGTMQLINLLSLKYIKPPPKWHCRKQALGEDVWFLRQEMSTGVTSGVKTKIHEGDRYDPRWLTVRFDTLDEAFVKARGYVLQGQKFRVVAGSDYHDVVEIILYKSKVWFVLSPYMAASDPVPYTTDQDHVVKSIVSLDGTRNLCTHVLESESVLSNIVQNGVSVKISVDARLWTKTYAVYSNSSIAYGNVLDLGQKITSGLDVRLLIQWLDQGKDRLIGTQLNTVRDDKKISSESTLTWQLDDSRSPELRLTTRCDFEYVLVTTDGYVEVATFNVWSPVVVRQETDVLITWFTG